MYQLQLLPRPTCSTAFLVLWQGPSIYESFLFLLFSRGGPLNGKIHKTEKHKVWSSGRDKMIRLYLKITENFIVFILLD